MIIPGNLDNALLSDMTEIMCTIRQFIVITNRVLDNAYNTWKKMYTLFIRVQESEYALLNKQ